MKKAAVAIVLMEHEDEPMVLMLKRSETDHSFPGTWCFPGGRVDENETEIDACIRELKEETNLDVISSPKLFGVYQGDYEFQIYAYMVEVKGTVKLSYEHDDFQLFSYYNYDPSELSGTATNKIFKDLRG